MTRLPGETEERLAAMRECLHAFEGSHSFHNYTQRRRYRPENMVSRREAKNHRCSQAWLCTCVDMPDCGVWQAGL